MNVKDEIINVDKLRNPAIIESYQYAKPAHLRNAIIYALLYIAIAAAIAFVFNVAIVPGSTSIRAVIIPSAACLLSGVLFTIFLYTKLNFLNQQNLGSGFWYSFIVFAGVFVAMLLIGVVKGKADNLIITCLFYSCLFILPYTIYQTWIFYRHISDTGTYKIWYLPEHSSGVPAATVFLNSIHIILKIAPTQGAAERMYETTVPGRQSLGNMFSNFIHDEEKKAAELFELKDEENQTYGWKFMTSSFFGIIKRPVDAELSLNENKIKSNAVIYARRVKGDSLNQMQLSV